MLGVIGVARMDLLKLLGLGKSLLLYLLILVCFQFSPATAAAAALMLLYLALYTVAAYDEQNKGDYLACSLPVSRAQVVQGKYLYALLALAVSVLLSAALSWLPLPGAGALRLSPALLFAVGAVFIAVTQPLLLWLGASKARWWVLGVYCVGFAVSGAAMAGKNSLELAAAVVGPLPSGPSVAVAGMALLLVSYLLARRLYGRRQFTD